MAMSEKTKAGRKVTTQRLKEMKSAGERIACLTAYDYLTAAILDASGIDVILVGDSAANVFAGYDTTIPTTMEQMLYHAQVVCRAAKRALVVADLPFMSYQVSEEDALRNAGRFIKEALAEAVKLEGGEQYASTVKRIVASGIPVMGHLGLTPQSIHKFGSYKTRGASAAEAEQIVNDARALQDAGAFAIVLEKIPANLARRVTAALEIPTIGIGAGAGCDGQILVTPDLLGITTKFRPRFVRRYAAVADTMADAFRRYAKDVRDGEFPSDKESY
ncbi:MAG TPA: 3-methyl-2-oxobutanoate hydroxymethyltransferase [Gammaproteobacteria bacterium]|nr:3-methyl-2-oxobutanoate hydroxymethyltransferase [Gammaproteobacteria bacterium]